MRKFNITVNGVSYEVEVEEVGGAASVQSAPAPASAPAVKAPQAAAPAPAKPAASAPAGATTVSAPMPGNILDMRVKVGDAVHSGDILCILEAMKMENEILAPKDGTVVAVNAAKGASVNTGDALVSLN